MILAINSRPCRKQADRFCAHVFSQFSSLAYHQKLAFPVFGYGTLSGTRKMTTQSQGMEIHTSGPFTGTQVLFIALKEGYLMKETVSTKMTGTIEIPDQNMSFPVVMSITSENGLVK